MGGQGLPQCVRYDPHPYWGRWDTLSTGHQAAHRSHAKIRALFEQAVATLKSWRLLRKLRCSTTRITRLSQGRRPTGMVDRIGVLAGAQGVEMMQTDLVDSGRIDQAMQNDINDVVTRFPGKYNNAMGDMIGALAGNVDYQAAGGIP